MNHNMEQLIQLYFIETHSFLEQFDAILLEVKENQYFSSENLQELFRILHTMKGSSSMMPVSSITEVAHKIEDLFSHIQSHGIHRISQPLQKELLQLLYSFSSFLQAELNSIENQQTLGSNIDHFAEKIKDISNKRKKKKDEELSDCPSLPFSGSYILQLHFPDDIDMERARSFVIVASLMKEEFSFEYYPTDLEKSSNDILKKQGLFLCFPTKEELQTARQHLEHNLDVTAITELPVFDVETSSPLHGETDFENDLVSSKDSDRKPNLPSSLVVQASKFESLEQLATQIMQCQSTLYHTLSEELPKTSGVFLELEHLQELSMELEHHASSFFLIPLSLLFEKMELLLHTLEEKLQKKVHFLTSGEDLMITKPAFDALNTACIHLIRNAMDHGIESTSQERVAACKNEIGTISILAALNSFGLSLTIQDDGYGINTNKILEKAKSCGLLKKSPSLYSHSEILELIFLPGFSMKQQVSEFSGRGIGMDIVSQIITSLNGKIFITSEPLSGTKIELSLPYSSIFSY